MLKLSIARLAKKRGIRNARVLSQRAGIAYGSCHALWFGEPKFIAMETLNKLCDTLEVTPGELFNYQPDSGALKSEEEMAVTLTPHPIIAMAAQIAEGVVELGDDDDYYSTILGALSRDIKKKLAKRRGSNGRKKKNTEKSDSGSIKACS